MFEILPMQYEDIDGVLAVEEASFSIPWHRGDFVRELTENKMAVYLVVKYFGKIVGYAGMWHVVNEGHITNVAILMDYRKMGLGDLLLQELLRIAIEREMIGVTLEVRISNQAAQRLYAKHGFRPEGLRKHYYTDTREDAVIMWRYFPVYENYDETEQ